MGYPLHAIQHYNEALRIDSKTEQHGIQLSDRERAEIDRALDRLRSGE